MSTTTNQRPPTVAQRAAHAAEQAAVYLGLDNAKVLTAVLAEAAAQELRYNRGFADRVRAAYEAAAPKPKPPTQRGGAPKQKAAKVKLVPIKDVGLHQINIAAEVDPYYLYEVFGGAQLPLALDTFSKKKLVDEVVPIVQRRHPEARPNAKADKQGVIAFIVHHVMNG
jgi:hypothetical protein